MTIRTQQPPADLGLSPLPEVLSEPAVEAIGASAAIGGRVIWSDVNFTLAQGEFIAVLGPNGVGKSTLVRAILGLQPLSSGRLRVLASEPGAARGLIGYLPQRRNFDEHIRIRGTDVVRLGLDGARWGVPLPGASRWSRRGRAEARRVEEVIERVGAAEYADRPVGRLSGGEQQRLLVAQALVHRPRLLLLDEPLDSLDLPNQASVAALISDISRAENVTVILVAHDVNPILPYLDGVVYLARGGVASGTVDEVITSEGLTRLYQTPIEVLKTADDRLVVVGQPEAPAHHVDRHVS
jgi:zinc/manganese transport system ATP-binding protein